MNPSEDTGKGRLQPAMSEWERALAFLERKGKQLYGEHFRIYPEDHPVLYKLLVYLRGEGEEASRLGISLRKGILLTGPVGCGKTSLMTLLRFFRSPAARFAITSCREVSFAFHREGYEVIRRYSQVSTTKKRLPQAHLFDDLGTESTLKYYGNTCNVMGEILLSRYDLFVAGNLVTHVTTNLTSTELEQSYGTRVRSRMREMFNLVSFGAGASDKRA
jgi:hypothetical protein